MGLTAVIDFETTGLSPLAGDRATEIAVVLLEDGRPVDRFESLMNAGVRLSAFIEAYTGITNAMVAAAPPAARVMADAARFVGEATPMVAHNAAFDRRFWQAELARIEVAATQPFACTLLLSRRLYPEAPSHRLGALAELYELPWSGVAHRAMADAEMAASLLARIRRDLSRRHEVEEADHPFLMRLQGCSRARMAAFIADHLARRPPVSEGAGAFA